jgi:hypothetical protein
MAMQTELLALVVLVVVILVAHAVLSIENRKRRH